MIPLWFANLSSRERDVALLLATGCTLGEVADKIGINPSTASTYKTRIFQKTGVTNEVRLALMCVHAGLVTTTGVIHALVRPGSLAIEARI